MSKRSSTDGNGRDAYLAQIVNRVRRQGPDRWDGAVARAQRRVGGGRPRGADTALVEAAVKGKLAG